MERDLAKIALFAALIAVLGLVPAIALGFGVPITAQGLGVMLAGAILGPTRGALAVLLFLLGVMLGLPILAGGRGGFGVFAGPTVGYLVGFPIAAFVIGLVIQKLRGLPPFLTGFIGAVIGGIAVLYIFGAIGMAFTLDKTMIEATVLAFSFTVGDLLKAVMTGLIFAALTRTRPDLLVWRDESVGHIRQERL